MFIGRVYENHKRNKQTTNTNTKKEQATKPQNRNRSRSVSDDESDEDPRIRKGGKDSENMKKSRHPVTNGSPEESDRESELEEYSKEAIKSIRKESGDKSFMERINEKVKKLKKEKDSNGSKVNGFSEDTKQVVYSVPSRDLEIGMKKSKPYSKDKFDSIELDSGDEKKINDEGGLKSLGVQASPYPPFRLRVLPHPDWKVGFIVIVLEYLPGSAHTIKLW